MKYLQLALLSLVFSFTASADVFDDAFALYHLDGNATDSSGSGLHGVTSGSISATTDRNGVAGGATLFTNAYMNMPHTNDFKFGTDDFSVSFWIKVDPITTSHLDNLGVLHNYSNTSNGSSNWGISMNDAYNGATPGTIGGGIDGVSISPAGIDLDDGQWHHFAIVRDATNLNVKMYYDGALVADGTSPGLTNIQNPNAPLALGNHLNRRYTFAADEMVFLNRTLTTNEVAFLSGTAAVPEPNSMAIVTLGLLGLGLAKRRRK